MTNPSVLEHTFMGFLAKTGQITECIVHISFTGVIIAGQAGKWCSIHSVLFQALYHRCRQLVRNPFLDLLVKNVLQEEKPDKANRAGDDGCYHPAHTNTAK